MSNVILWFVATIIFVPTLNIAIATVWRTIDPKLIWFFPLYLLQAGIILLGIMLWCAIPEMWTYLNRPSLYEGGVYPGTYFVILAYFLSVIIGLTMENHLFSKK